MAELLVRIIYPELVPSTMYDWRDRRSGYAIEKPKQTFRILVLGDSITFGWGVKKEEAFPQRLEDMLNNSSSEIKFEVINFGFAGMNTIYELELLTSRGLNPETWRPDARYRGLAYQPDLILLEYTTNDANTSMQSLWELAYYTKNQARLNSGAYSWPIPEKLDKYLLYNSRFYLYFMELYGRALIRLGLRPSAVEHESYRFQDDSIGWVLSREAMLKIANIGKKIDIPTVLFVYPMMGSFENYPMQGVHQKIERAAEIYGFNVLDIVPAFRESGIPGKYLRVSLIDSHPSAKAHEITAKAIFEYLKKNKFLP